MTIFSRPGFPALTCAAAILAGCAQNGDFPSLQPRPAENRAAEPAQPADEPAPAADPALSARLAELVAEAEAGQRAFEAELGRASALVARAGGAESETWIEAHLALSRLEASRTATVTAAAEVDAIAAERSRAGAATTAADLAAIAATGERIDSLAQAQRDEILRLGTQLSHD